MKPKSLILSFVVASVLLVAALAGAQQTPTYPTYTTYGVGDDSCGRFLQEKQNDSVRANTYMIWVQGYLTAFGKTVAAFRKVPMQPVDVAGADVFITQYCTDYQVMKVEFAAYALAMKLVDK